MQKAKEQGKIRFIGCSCGAREALAAIACGGFDAVQISYSMLDLQMEAEVLPAAATSDIGVIVKDGLGGGLLTQKISRLGDDHADLKARVGMLRELAGAWRMSLPEMAVRFVLSNAAVSTVIAGTRSRIHLGENLKAADGDGLNSEQMDQLRRYL